MSRLLYVLPLAFMWMAITGRLAVDSFVVGCVLGLSIVALLRPRAPKVSLRRLPDQLLAAVVYAALLLRDMVLSSIDVARRVLSRDMRLKPGIIAVSTQDPAKSQLTAALSANAITLTPGELVVELEDNHIMYIHCLDVEASRKDADRAQARRIGFLLRILGRSQ
ncbi:MAG: Na+/H+ antiporter subunit E [Anaerolineae bacterium]|nr:Na+/H+ antiporter subunit E [Anaerolineae bacterium]